MIKATIIKKDIKNIYLKVKPNGEVTVSVPKGYQDRDIEFVLEKRAKWIEEKVAFFKAHNKAVIKEYVSGENFRYLGKNYRLKVIESKDEGVKLQRGYLQVFVKNRDDLNKKKKLLDNWYRQKAKENFNKAIEKYKKIVQKDISKICIREMKSRWGSCNAAKGYINLNLKLIEKSTQCIEYVVFHELTHLIYPNHSQKFYNYLTLHMPDWKRRKERLEDIE